MKNLVFLGQLIIGVLVSILTTEHADLGGGTAKKKVVLATTESAVKAALGPAAEEDGFDLEKLLELVGNLIDAVVALLNFLGIFRHGG